MGAPEGHPFFGNQYTDGGYVPGSFTYATADILESIFDSLRETASEKAISTAVKPKAVDLSPFDDVNAEHSNNLALIITGILAGLAAIGGIIWWRHRRKAKIEKEALQSIELRNVGICIKCGNPLSESVYVPENKADNLDAYIVCKSCGEKNFARYPDSDDSSSKDADEEHK